MYRGLFIEENSLIENFTAIVYLAALLTAVFLYVRDKNNQFRIVLLIPTLLALIGFLDEIQWGEILFGWQMPMFAGTKINGVHAFIDLVRETYAQQRTIYKVSGILIFSTAASVVGFQHGKSVLKMFSHVTQRSMHYSWALFIFLGVGAVCLDQIFDVMGTATFFEEMLEMNAALALVLASVETHKFTVCKQAAMSPAIANERVASATAPRITNPTLPL